jgi:hypothetical protein
MAISSNPGNSPGAPARPTEIVVRVISKDSKFIGTSMGGMRITLRDAHTGELLATGIIVGGTGVPSGLCSKAGAGRALGTTRPPGSPPRSTWTSHG